MSPWHWPLVSCPWGLRRSPQPEPSRARGERGERASRRSPTMAPLDLTAAVLSHRSGEHSALRSADASLDVPGFWCGDGYRARLEEIVSSWQKARRTPPGDTSGEMVWRRPECPRPSGARVHGPPARSGSCRHFLELADRLD